MPATIAKSDVSIDDSRLEPTDAVTTASIVCGRTSGSSGSSEATRWRIDGTSDSGSASVRTANAIVPPDTCACGTYDSGTGALSSERDRTSPTTPITSRTTLDGSYGT